MYLDDISNDAVKCGIHVLEAPLLHMYNQDLNSGRIPHIWSDGLIIPLYKKNDKLCEDDYRGLIISSCVGKLFTKILTKRMDEFIRINGLWKFNPCSFKADFRTKDMRSTFLAKRLLQPGMMCLFVIISISSVYFIMSNWPNVHT